MTGIFTYIYLNNGPNVGKIPAQWSVWDSYKLNHSESGVVNQLVAILGAPPCVEKENASNMQIWSSDVEIHDCFWCFQWIH